MDYKISQALNDLKNFYGLEEFREVNLNMVDVTKPFIKFKSGDDTWILTLKKEDTKPHWYSAEEGESGTL
jgi:hypothetical protein